MSKTHYIKSITPQEFEFEIHGGKLFCNNQLIEDKELQLAVDGISNLRLVMRDIQNDIIMLEGTSLGDFLQFLINYGKAQGLA